MSLTFDDGPVAVHRADPGRTRRYGIKATFCQIGDQVGAYPAIEARIRAEGHTFCDHSWDHDEALPARSVAVIDSEISRTQQAIKAVTRVTPRYYRAPGGDWGRTNRLRLELARFHTVPLAWADDSLDWTKPGVAAIVHTVLSTVSPGAIVLMHDGGGQPHPDHRRAPEDHHGTTSGRLPLRGAPPEPHPLILALITIAGRRHRIDFPHSSHILATFTSAVDGDERDQVGSAVATAVVTAVRTAGEVASGAGAGPRRTWRRCGPRNRWR